MGCAQARLRTPIDVSTIESLVETGDLILFSSKHPTSHITKCFTASAWDHVGLVVKLSATQVFILEYAGGVFLYPLLTRLYSYFAIQGREIVLRRLSLGVERRELQGRVELFVRGVLGNTAPSIEEIVIAVLSQEATMASFIASMRGGEREDDLSSLFCSKLVAAVYKDAGLIATCRTASDFLPKHFSQHYDGYLDLQQGALLGGEVPISFASMQQEISDLKSQMAARQAAWFRPETVVALASNLYLSARSLRGELSELAGSFSDSWTSLRGMVASGALGSDPAPVRLTPGLGGHSDAAPRTPQPASGGGGGGGGMATPSAGERWGLTPAAVSDTGGVQLDSGPIVDEVMDLADGGIYTPGPATPVRPGLVQFTMRES